MTGYQSKKEAAQDKMAHLTLEQRCRISEQCLPDAPYRAMLIALHDEMLKALAQRTWVGLTAEEAAECWTTSATQTWKNFEAALKEKNNGFYEGQK